ncbi:MAG: copper chaperone PCu(A)C [Gemmatimonadota bacterium]|nr:MAG: copper chaperone PCu(A)C [Gemmatimonadota bacterium]
MMTNRTHTIRHHAILVLAVTTALACASRETPESIDLEVSQVFVTEPVTGERAAMYFSVTNNGDVDDELLAVSTMAAEVAEIHRTEQEGGTMKMVPVDALPVPAGGRVDLAPGGYHVMLLELTQNLFPNDRFDVTLRFRHAGEVVARARVIRHEDVEELVGSAAQRNPQDSR